MGLVKSINIMHEQIPLSDSIISQIADQYQKEVELEEIFQNDKRNQIKELTQLIINSINKPIYELLYKEEYGDYREYCELVAKELRRRNHINL
jgi:hypothetical protein